MQQAEYFRQQPFQLRARLLVEHGDHFVIIRRQICLQRRDAVAQLRELILEAHDGLRQFLRKRARLLGERRHEQGDQTDERTERNEDRNQQRDGRRQSQSRLEYVGHSAQEQRQQHCEKQQQKDVRRLHDEPEQRPGQNRTEEQRCKTHPGCRPAHTHAATVTLTTPVRRRRDVRSRPR